jgi:hypothetical protein
MTYLANTLITRSFYLSKVVARDLQVPTGAQISTGLFLLNALLDWKSYDTTLIPYWTYDTSITTVANQETYDLPNIYDVESVTFNIGTVRYSMDKMTRKSYFAGPRVDGIASLPGCWRFEKGYGGGTLYLYFLPLGAYPLKMMVKKGLTDVTLVTDLSTVYDNAYIEYLRYALAQYICADWGKPFDEEASMNLKRIVRQLMYVSPPDLVTRKSSILVNGGGINFGDVNIGHLWRPS